MRHQWKQSFVRSLDVNCRVVGDCDSLVVGCAVYKEAAFYACAEHLPEDGVRFDRAASPSSVATSSASLVS
jgi:hypothetical protein